MGKQAGKLPELSSHGHKAVGPHSSICLPLLLLTLLPELSLVGPLCGRGSWTSSLLPLPGWASEKASGGTLVTDKKTEATGEAGTSQVLMLSQGQNSDCNLWAPSPSMGIPLFFALVYKQRQNK